MEMVEKSQSSQSNLNHATKILRVWQWKCQVNQFAPQTCNIVYISYLPIENLNFLSGNFWCWSCMKRIKKKLNIVMAEETMLINQLPCCAASEKRNKNQANQQDENNLLKIFFSSF